MEAEMSWRQMELFLRVHGGPDKPLMSSIMACYDLWPDDRVDLRDVAAFNNRRT